MNSERIAVDQYIARPPNQVWPFLTTPAGLAAWWVHGDVAPVVGHHFLLEMPGWGNVPCVVENVDEPHRFVHTMGDWTLTWTLIAEGHGTRLLLEHAGFDLDRPNDRFAFDNMGPGWRHDVLPRLAAAAQAG